MSKVGEYYKTYVLKVLREHNLGGDYNIQFEDSGSDDLAWIRFNTGQKWAVFGINRKRNITNKEIRRSALHEVGHFIAMRLFELANERYATETEIKAEYESVAVAFANIVSRYTER